MFASKANNWRPAATMERLRQRAALLAQIRSFFAERQVLEVETPLLSHATVPDTHLQSIRAELRDPASAQTLTCYLQTSPEYAMKRLLAAGAGSMYQLCKAFREDELGRLHNPEFTLLEWYRLDFDHHALMTEVDELLQALLHTPSAERYSYAEVFERFLGVNPHEAGEQALEDCARRQSGLELNCGRLSRDGWLQFLLSHCLEPQLGQERPTFIYDFPVSQAALARIRPEKIPVASRFEVYYRGIELGNGFHELQSAPEQRQRFLRDLNNREQQGLAGVPLDERLLAALSQGLPDCAGVALGVDRLIMLALGCRSIAEVLSFKFDQA